MAAADTPDAPSGREVWRVALPGLADWPRPATDLSLPI